MARGGNNVSGAVSEQYLGIIGTSFGCDIATARAIAKQAGERHFAARAIIAHAGDGDHGAWMILSGAAQELAYGPGGHHILVHEFAPGDLFGEAAGVTLPTSAGEVAAVSAVDAGHFASANFVILMESYGCVATSVTRALIARLTQTTRRLVEGATLTAAGRIHAELLRQARASDAMTIRPAPVITAFALHVQTTRETVSRTISALERSGIVRRENGAMLVVAPHRLEELIF